jgi:hypothetical protein
MRMSVPPPESRRSKNLRRWREKASSIYDVAMDSTPGPRDPASEPAAGLHREEQGEAEKRPPAWIVPAVAITVLSVGGWYIIQNLSETSKMEDCTMAGRHNCVEPIDTSKVGR